MPKQPFFERSKSLTSNPYPLSILRLTDLQT